MYAGRERLKNSIDRRPPNLPAIALMAEHWAVGNDTHMLWSEVKKYTGYSILGSNLPSEDKITPLASVGRKDVGFPCRTRSLANCRPGEKLQSAVIAAELTKPQVCGRTPACVAVQRPVPSSRAVCQSPGDIFGVALPGRSHLKCRHWAQHLPWASCYARNAAIAGKRHLDMTAEAAS